MLFNLIELTHNLALLVALSMLSGFLRRPSLNRVQITSLQGLLFGATAVIGMMQPLVLGAGLIFDGRSIVISLCALCFGPLAAGIAGGLAGLYRIALGGVGLPMGLLVIASSVGLGLLFHQRWIQKKVSLTAGRLLLFGLLVHLAMVLMAFALPAETALGVIRQLGLPVLVGYPLVTLLIGKMLSIQEAEAQSVETLRKISTAVEQSPVSVVITDAKGAIEYVNPKFTEVTGYSTEEALGKNSRFLKSGEMSSEAYRELWLTIMAGSVWQGEFHNKKKNGELYWEHASISPVRNAQGTIISFVAVKEDITQQKQVEASLRTSEAHYRHLEAHYRSLVEGIPGIVYVFSSTRGGIYYSSQVTEVLGYTPEQLYAQPLLWHDTIHTEDLPRVNACIHAAKEGKAFGVEYRIKDAQGHYRWFDDRSTEVRQNGDEVLIEGFVLDITERKQAEQDRLNLEKKILHDHRLESLGVLAGGIAHDFNNILTSILGNAELTSLRLGKEHPLRTNAENILIAGRRARDLVQKILLFSRQNESDREPLQATQALEQIAAQVRKVLPETLTLHVEADTAEAIVLMNPGEMHQVLMNLCMNGLQAMREVPNGVLSLSARRLISDDQPWVEFMVSDMGVGIPPEIRNRIFEPFFTTRSVDEGLGLGLSVVHGIIKRAGGSITVDSEPGTGTQFHILLPEAVDSITSP
jgi:PAS domain S-box-containing protein